MCFGGIFCFWFEKCSDDKSENNFCVLMSILCFWLFVNVFDLKIENKVVSKHGHAFFFDK